MEACSHSNSVREIAGSSINSESPRPYIPAAAACLLSLLTSPRHVPFPSECCRLQTRAETAADLSPTTAHRASSKHTGAPRAPASSSMPGECSVSKPAVCSDSSERTPAIHRGGVRHRSVQPSRNAPSDKHGTPTPKCLLLPSALKHSLYLKSSPTAAEREEQASPAAKSIQKPSAWPTSSCRANSGHRQSSADIPSACTALPTPTRPPNLCHCL